MTNGIGTWARHARALVVSGIVGLAVCGTAAQAGGLVGLSSATPGALFDISSSTGAASQTVSLTGTSFTSLVGLEFLGGKLYATDVAPNGGNFSFGTIDMVTGAFTAINNQDGSANWHGLAGNEAALVLYTIDINDSNRLKSVTPSGIVTTIGATDPSIDGRGMAYDDTHGILYATGGGNLYQVNVLDATATLIGAMGIPDGQIGLAYDEDAQVLYANSGDLNFLYSLDVSSGQATRIGANGTQEVIDGLTWIPSQDIPEPAMPALLGLALVAWHVSRLRGRRV